MAEKQSKQQSMEAHDRAQDKAAAAEKKKFQPQEEKNEILVRILGYDIPGSKNVYSGLTRIKGVSWTVSNATCLLLKLPRTRKIETLSKDDIATIEKFLRSLPLADFLKNRRWDRETGHTSHVFGSDLDIKREFDIKRLKEIRSYKGIRHTAKLPVRGQRTRSHFRTKGRAMGIKKKK